MSGLSVRCRTLVRTFVGGHSMCAMKKSMSMLPMALISFIFNAISSSGFKQLLKAFVEPLNPPLWVLLLCVL